MWPFRKKPKPTYDLTSLEKGKCPVCGGDVSGREAGLSYVLRCHSCNWSIASTNRHHPAWDKNLYDIWVEAHSTDEAQALADIAHLWHVDANEARSILQGQLPAERGAAVERVFNVYERAAVCGLKVRIKPDFEWNLEENPFDPRHGPPCPYCGRNLASAKAKQCFVCGTNWRDPSNVTRRGKNVAERPPR